MKVPLMAARDVMKTDLITVSPDASIEHAIDLILTNRVSGLPVVDRGGDLAGLISEHDCLTLFAGDEHAPAGVGLDDPVRAIMTRATLIVPPERGLVAIANLLIMHRIHRVPVVDRGRLVGLVARRDVLRGIRDMQRAGEP